MRKISSITRRLTLSVLSLELLAAIILIAIVTIHERHVQFEAFDANLRATANALLGSVQEADTKDGSVVLDLRGVKIPARSVFRVTDEHGKILGSSYENLPNNVPSREVASSFIAEYRFFTMSGDRVIDPGDSGGGVRHHIKVIYGLPEGRIWHEVFESVRYFAIATVVLLSVTALLLSWFVRDALLPIRELAFEADKINSENWEFSSPPSAKQNIELIPLAAAIETTIARLRRAFQQQRRMTNDAAHELKTDISIIKSSFQVLTMKRRTVEEYEMGIDVGARDIGRLEQTVQKMLTLARLEQDQTADRKSSSLDEVMLDVLSQGESLAEIKKIRIVSSLNGTGNVPIPREDASLLFSNILVNAIQHSPENSEVIVSSDCEGGNITLTVRDHGQGVHDQDRPFLFDPFYRADPSRSRKSGGTGLGLSISKAICDRANGEIDIRNHPTGGAIVTIVLPRH